MEPRRKRGSTVRSVTLAGASSSRFCAPKRKRLGVLGLRSTPSTPPTGVSAAGTQRARTASRKRNSPANTAVTPHRQTNTPHATSCGPDWPIMPKRREKKLAASAVREVTPARYSRTTLGWVIDSKYTSEPPTTLCEAFQRNAAIDPDAVALRTPGDTQTMTWREYAADVRRVAAGLAGLGIRRGDTVSLMMANRIEFYPLEVGAQHVGATSFSVYNTLAAEQLTHLFENAGTKVLICEGQYVDRVRASGAEVEHIVCIDGSPEGTTPLADMLAAGADDFDFESAWRAVQPDDIATLIYTSGTTGNPKGVEMTHANLLFEALAVEAVLGVEFGDRITSFLPSAHIADRMTGLYTQEVFGTQVTVVSDTRAIAAALPDVRPTIWGAVPRVWEKLKAGIEFVVANEPDEAARKALQWGTSVAAKRAAALVSGKPVPDDVAQEWAQAD